MLGSKTRRGKHCVIKWIVFKTCGIEKCVSEYNSVLYPNLLGLKKIPFNNHLNNKFSQMNSKYQLHFWNICRQHTIVRFFKKDLLDLPYLNEILVLTTFIPHCRRTTPSLFSPQNTPRLFNSPCNKRNKKNLRFS